MFASVLSQLTSLLDNRFTLTAFFPSLVFSLGLLIAYLLGGEGLAAGIEAWQGLDLLEQTVLAIAATTTVFVLARTVSGQLLRITRLFEGYYFRGRWFGGLGARWHTERRAAASADMIYFEYSANDPVAMPTSLGNILRSGEAYAEERYGVRAAVAWPRLYHLLPPDHLAALAAARSSMEGLLVVSLLAAVFALVSGVYLALSAGPLGWLLVFYVGGAAISATAYYGALGPASSFGEHVKTAFDLHRRELLDALGVSRPSSLSEERRRWREVDDLLYANVPSSWPLPDPPPDGA